MAHRPGSLFSGYAQNIIRNMAFAVVLSSSLGACSSGIVAGVFDKEEETSDLPQHEDRLSVLALEEEIAPDPRFQNKEILLPPPYINAEWTQPGGEPDHSMHNLATGLSFQPVWKANIGSRSQKRIPLISPPIVADGLAFVLDASAQVQAFDTITGQRVWAKTLAVQKSEKRRFFSLQRAGTLGEIGFGGGIAHDKGRVFIGTGFGFVAAFDAQSGDLVWRVETLTPIRSAPMAIDGKVFVTTNVNELIVLAQDTGEQLWTYQTFAEPARFLTPSSPAIAEGVIVAPFSSGEVTALNAENGRQLWSRSIGRSSRRTALSELSDIAGSPVIDQGVAYAISHAGQLSALDVRSGREIWQSGIGGLQMPWVSGDYLFLISLEHQLICLNRSDGAVVWVSDLPKYKNESKRKKPFHWFGPVVGNGKLLLVSSHGQMRVMSPQNGAVLSVHNIGAGSQITPIIAEEGVFILSDTGVLTLYR